MSQATVPPQATAVTMTHRQILEALSGLLLGLFVAILSSTVISNALPRIITELHGGQSAYTWVVTRRCSRPPRPPPSGASWPT